MKVKSLYSMALLLCVSGGMALHAKDPAGFDPSPYQYQRELVGGPGGESLGSMILDAEVYRNSGLLHEKLRLVKKSGDGFTELAWIVEPTDRSVTPGGERHLPHQIESFNENDDGSIELTVALPGNSPPPSRLEILTPMRNFEKSVTISSTSDGAAWTPLVSNVLVFDYERFVDFRRTGLTLPETTARRFKVRIAGATDQQRSLVGELSRTVSDASGLSVTESGVQETRHFRIEEIRFFSSPAKGREKDGGRSYALNILGQSPDASGKGTEILIDGGGLPLRELTLATADRNFRREVQIQVPDRTPSGGWRTIHHGTVYCYRVGDFREEQLSLSFDETRSDRYRIVISNEDSPPLSIDGVTGKGDAYELLFLAAPDDQYFLFLGSPSTSMEKPRLDTAAISAARNRKVPRTGYEPGPLTENTRYRKETATGRGLLDSKGFLWSTIAVVVAVLILILYRTLQRVEVMEDAD